MASTSNIKKQFDHFFEKGKKFFSKYNISHNMSNNKLRNIYINT
jgi:hypothetical protein